jgi:hypothetical protein
MNLILLEFSSLLLFLIIMKEKIVKNLITPLLLLQVTANKGERTTTVLIDEAQPSNNTPGNAMDLTYWTYTENSTEDDGVAYINMVAGLRIEAPPEGSTIVWGTFLPKIAGKKSSFDVGLC